uniref:Uncharacterized protein n=1 Tax=Phlebotomus papatasi TaxID=29031 RepID=A0A1B0DQC5_PHLPP
MDRDRSMRHQRKKSKKSGKKSKKRHRSRDEMQEDKNGNDTSTSQANVSRIVEYSDVSSEDFSAPEAGEIQTDESDGAFSFAQSTNSSNKRLEPSELRGSFMSTSTYKREVVIKPAISHLPETTTRRVIIGSPIGSSSTSSLSRRSKRSPEYVHGKIQHVVSSPTLAEEFDDDDRPRKRSKKEKKHKKTKKTKKRKKRARHKSVSSVESISENDSVLDVDSLTPPLKADEVEDEEEAVEMVRQPHTPPVVREASPISPSTPPLRSDSRQSGYSDRHCPESVKKRPDTLIASPHTPPLHTRKYHSPEDEMPPSVNHLHHHGSHRKSGSNESIKSPNHHHSSHSMYSSPVSKRSRLSNVHRERSNDRNDYKNRTTSSSSSSMRKDRDWDRRRDSRRRTPRSPRRSPPRRSPRRSPIRRSPHPSSMSPSHRRRSSSRVRKRPYSPPGSPPAKATRLHSRSRSPRVFRGGGSPTVRKSKAVTPTRESRSKTPPISIRKIDIKEKISDTSLFAELVKDKHKREKALQEILEKKDDDTAGGATADNSAGADGSAESVTSNGINESGNNNQHVI